MSKREQSHFQKNVVLFSPDLLILIAQTGSWKWGIPLTEFFWGEIVRNRGTFKEVIKDSWERGTFLKCFSQIPNLKFMHLPGMLRYITCSEKKKNHSLSLPYLLYISKTWLKRG